MRLLLHWPRSTRAYRCCLFVLTETGCRLYPGASGRFIVMLMRGLITAKIFDIEDLQQNQWTCRSKQPLFYTQPNNQMPQRLEELLFYILLSLPLRLVWGCKFSLTPRCANSLIFAFFCQSPDTLALFFQSLSLLSQKLSRYFMDATGLLKMTLYFLQFLCVKIYQAEQSAQASIFYHPTLPQFQYFNNQFVPIDFSIITIFRQLLVVLQTYSDHEALKTWNRNKIDKNDKRIDFYLYIILKLDFSNHIFTEIEKSYYHTVMAEQAFLLQTSSHIRVIFRTLASRASYLTIFE